MSQKIFITGTFRIEWNKNYNQNLADALESRGFECYLPQRDTEQTGDKKKTFAQNIQGIRNAQSLLAVGLNLQSVNWGFEIGLAYALSVPVIIITDKPEDAHIMPFGAANRVFIPKDINDIEGYIDELIDAINLALSTL